MITLEDWAVIRRAHFADGESQRSIAERLGVSRNTVAKVLASEKPPKYERTPTPTSVARFERRIRVLLEENPKIPATVLAERVGWQGSQSWFRKSVTKLREEYRPKDPADRLSYEFGDLMQCDLWFPGVPIPIGDQIITKAPVLVMVAAAPRFSLARMLPTRTTPDLILGMGALIADYGAVPHRLLWDNEAGIGQRGHLTASVTTFAGFIGTKIVQARPYDPETKGVVERTNGYLETSFLPARRFSSPADFNSQLSSFLTQRANMRTIRSLGTSPISLVRRDRDACVALRKSPWAPPSERIRLSRDYYIRVSGNDYSVDPRAIGTFVNVACSLEEVRVTALGKVLAFHERAWGSGRTITDAAHVAIAKEMRTVFQAGQQPSPCDPLYRDLTDYDRHFGVTL